MCCPRGGRCRSRPQSSLLRRSRVLAFRALLQSRGFLGGCACSRIVWLMLAETFVIGGNLSTSFRRLLEDARRRRVREALIKQGARQGSLNSKNNGLQMWKSKQTLQCGPRFLLCHAMPIFSCSSEIRCARPAWSPWPPGAPARWETAHWGRLRDSKMIGSSASQVPRLPQLLSFRKLLREQYSADGVRWMGAHSMIRAYGVHIGPTHKASHKPKVPGSFEVMAKRNLVAAQFAPHEPFERDPQRPCAAKWDALQRRFSTLSVCSYSQLLE